MNNVEAIDIQHYPSVDLGKWPRLVVTGNPVTPTQAMEILIRTDDLQLTSNDSDFSRQCGNYLYGIESNGKSGGHWSSYDAFRIDDEDEKVDWEKYYAAREKMRTDLGVLELDYLTNNQIISCWIGGAKGWCDWNGIIATSVYNIGKHPSTEEVHNEWKIIAEAFPYLNLRCQLIAEEGEGEIGIEFEVKDGAAAIVPIGPPLWSGLEVDTAAIFLANLENPDRDKGCTFEYFKKAVDHTRSVILSKKGEQSNGH